MKLPERLEMSSVLNGYHIGDARTISVLFPHEEFVDATITSPPYWNLKDYGSKYQVGYGQKYEAYLADLGRIFKATYEITKKTGSLWVVADTIKWNGELKLFPFDLASRLRRIGWVLQDVIVWHKDKTLPWSHRGKLRNIFEYVLFFTKGPKFKYYLSRVRETDDLKEWWVRYPERYSPQGKAPTRTWSIAIPRQGSWGDNWVRHFCPFPPEIVRRIVLLTTKKGDVVFDPFAGSGVVLAQSQALNRNYVGLDLRKRYRQMFRSKVLPSIVGSENGKSAKHLANDRKKKAHAGLIWRLRKTKYARELMRLYEREHGRLGPLGVLALAKKRNRMHVLFVFPTKKRVARTLGARLQGLMRKPPLSKYGLQVKVSWFHLTRDSKKELRKRGIPLNTRLGVYMHGRTYRVAAQVTAADFVGSLQNMPRRGRAVAPIASNVRVQVPTNVNDANPSSR